MPDFATIFTDLDSSAWITLTLRMVLVYVFLLWAAIIVWVARDAVSRTKNVVFQVVALLLVIFLNVFGLIIYLIVRPQKTLLERYYEDLEQRTLAEGEDACPSCARTLPAMGRFCPACGVEVRVPCEHCRKFVSRSWARCVYCGKEREKDMKQRAKNG